MGSFFQWARVFFKEPPSLTPQDEGKPTSINHQYKSKKWIAKAYLLISLSVVLKLNRSLEAFDILLLFSELVRQWYTSNKTKFEHCSHEEETWKQQGSDAKDG